jgi:hypothetical protein
MDKECGKDVGLNMQAWRPENNDDAFVRNTSRYADRSSDEMHAMTSSVCSFAKTRVWHAVQQLKI